MADSRLQLQSSNDEFLQAINRRCEVSDHSDTVFFGVD